MRAIVASELLPHCGPLGSGRLSCVNRGDGMLYVGRWASYEELRGRPKGRHRGLPLYLC